MLGLHRQELFCEPCAKHFSGVVPYQQHLESEKHKKKLIDAQYFKQMLTETDGQGLTSALLKERSASPLQMPGEIQQRHVLTKVSMPAPLYECKVCDKTFTGQVPYQIHLNSIVHNKKIMMFSTTSSQNKLPCRLSSNDLNAGLNFSYKQIGLPLIEIPLVQIPLEKLSCAACKVKYDNLEETLEHYESDDHRSKTKASILTGEQRKFSEGSNSSQSKSGYCIDSLQSEPNEIVAGKTAQADTDHLRNEWENKIDGFMESLKDITMHQRDNKVAKEIKVLDTDDDLNQLID